MEPSKQLKKEAAEVISKYFGQHTAELYETFYADKPDETVLFSLEELLTEHLGEKETRKQVDLLKNNVGIK